MSKASVTVFRYFFAEMTLGLLLLTTLAFAGLDPAGEIDSAFNTVGYNMTNFAQVDTFAEARAVELQKNGVNAGKHILAGVYYDAANSHVALLRLHTNGTQDMGFGTGGVTKTAVGSSDYANDVAIQSDDKIVVAGYSSDAGFQVIRYSAEGLIDTTFGTNGIVSALGPSSTQNCAFALAIQTDGKILAAGYTRGAAFWDVAVLRLNTNGSIDTTFSGDGWAVVSVTGGTSAERAYDMAIQTDGKIVLAGVANSGSSTCNGSAYTDQNSIVLRLNSNGTVDTGFDTDGIVVLSLGSGNCPDDSFRGVTLQSDGKIVVTGGAVTTHDGSTNAKTNISVARLLGTNGSLDATFGTGGWTWKAIASTSGYLTDMGFSVRIQTSDNKIVIGAYTTAADNKRNFAVLRYTTAGALDTTYDTDGYNLIDFGADDNLWGMTLDGSNRAVPIGYKGVDNGTSTDYYIAAARLTTAGASDTTFGSSGVFLKQLQGGSTEAGYALGLQSTGRVIVVGSTNTDTSTDFALVRYDANGLLDTTFDTDGKATGDYAGNNDTARAIAIQTNDRIVVAGGSNGASAGSTWMTVMRFTANGVLDTTFNTTGVAAIKFGSTNNSNEAHGVAIQSDGKIVAVGTTSESSADWNFAVARFNTNGSLDTSFDTDGKVVLNLKSGGMDEANAVAIQNDGKILVGGFYYPSSSVKQIVLVRLNTNGSLDTSFDGDGKVFTIWGSGTYPTNEITGLAVLPDGKIVASGNCNEGISSPQSNNVVCALRYNSNGSLDTTFDGDGITVTNLESDRFDRGYAVGLQRDDKIVVFGNSMKLYVTSDDFLVLRYNWDLGDLDLTFGPANAGYNLTAVTSAMDQAMGGWVTSGGVIYTGGTANSSDLGAARYQSDPTAIAAGTPDLLSASDSGISNTDNITNDNTPTFSGMCNVGETTILKTDGSTTSPLARSLCRTGTYNVTALTTLDGVRQFKVFSRNGKNDSADSATLSITIDTVAAPPAITSPINGGDYSVPPSPTITGNGAEANASVVVLEGAATVCTATANGSGNWSCVSSLGFGSHTITARQTDIAGNVSASSTAITFTLTQYADLSVTKTDAQTTDIPGTTITYTVTVSNLGPNDAPSSTITDTMPAALAGVTWTCAGTGGSTCTAGGSGNINDIATIKASATVTYTVTATIDPSYTGILSNTASAATYLNVPGGIVDTVPGNNSSIDSTTMTPQADLSISKTDSADPVNAATSYSYTLTIANAGPSTATSLSATDTLPTGVIYGSASGTGWSCGFATPTVTCTRAVLTPGAAPAITINVTAPNEGGPVNNSCAITSAVTDPTSANNSDTEATTITPIANLSVSTTDSADPVNGGDAYAYTVSVGNAGPSTATSLTVTDTLPAGTTFSAASGTDWSCGHLSGIVTCTRASLAVVAAPAITISLTAPTSGGPITNNVSVSAAETDPVPANNSDSETTYICQAASTVTNNTAVDLGVCADTGVRIDWASDVGNWGDGGSGTRTYDVLRDGTPIQTNIAYGTTSFTDTTGSNGVSYSYKVRYQNGCGNSVITTGATAADVIALIPTITGSAANTCPSQIVLLSTESGMSSYQWFLGGNPISGATTNEYVAELSGQVTVRYTNGNGCTVTSADHPVTITFCGTTEVSSAGSAIPARLTKDSGSSTGYYLYFEKILSATGYNIYEGTLGSFYSHGSAVGNVCGATATDMGNGELRVALTLSSGNDYYLVTGFGNGFEGPSGFAGDSTEIPPSSSTCTP